MSPNLFACWFCWLGIRIGWALDLPSQFRTWRRVQRCACAGCRTERATFREWLDLSWWNTRSDAIDMWREQHPLPLVREVCDYASGTPPRGWRYRFPRPIEPGCTAYEPNGDVTCPDDTESKP